MSILAGQKFELSSGFYQNSTKEDSIEVLVIDENNIICNGYNEKVFKYFEKHGVTPHIINFRHRYFWDGGLHCVTSDLHREGKQKDYFPDRNYVSDLIA